MNPLADVVLKVSLILSSALMIAVALRSKSAALRHWVLAVGIVCAAATPFLIPVAPAWTVPVWLGPPPSPVAPSQMMAVPAPPDVAATAPDLSVGDPRRAATVRFTSWEIMAWIWMSGTAIASVIFLAGLARLAWIRARARPMMDGKWVSLAQRVAAALRIRRPITLLQSDQPSLLFTWGHFRPIVILPRDAHDWSVERAHIVLCHELAHVRRGDWLVLIAAELLRVVYWFNPLAWIAGTQLRDESERACDDEVMGQGIEGAEYAEELLALARILNAERTGWVAAPAMARRSSLERRVTAMVNHHVNRQPVGRAPRVLIFAMLFVLAVAVGGLTTAAQSFASYNGAVVDQTGNVVAGVELTLTNKRTGQKYQVKSSDVGSFEFVGLASGEYELATISPGFRNAKTPMTIGNKNITGDIRLEVGSLEETITVVDRGEPRVEGAGPTARGYKWPPDQAACTAKPTGGYIAPPTKLQDARPVYPRSGGVPKAASVVVLDARIGTDGSVVEARGVDPAADPDLVAAAVDAVKLWKYSPTLLNCIPIEVQMKVTVNFRTE